MFEKAFPRQLVQAIAESTNYNIELNQKGERVYESVSATGSNPHGKPPKSDAQGKVKPWKEMLVTEAKLTKYIALSMHAGRNRRAQMKLLWASDIADQLALAYSKEEYSQSSLGRCDFSVVF